MPVKTVAKNTSGKFIQKQKKRKVRRQVQKGQAYIKATYNNTLVTLADMHGNVLAWSSSGYLGFKGAKKATTYAAGQVVLDVTEKVQKYGLKNLDVYVKGVGSGREAAVRTLAQKGFNLNMIKDRTPIPHNGCRPRKPRRV
ncbi:MAG: 30S ribosomal protein S11 [Candidatus Moranbacteria bacterium]|nr:30S ribosomal protein S11 [Candidatus Moranbacteria bacterium]